MNTSTQKFEYIKGLQSFKRANLIFQSQLKIQNSNKTLTDKTSQKVSEEHRMQHIQQLITKIKVNSIVKQFIYKVRRNIAEKQPQYYEQIYNTLTQKKVHQNYHRALNINERLIAVFMVINILAILAIQTLSAFQGFYLEYQQQEGHIVAIIVLEGIFLAVFFTKLVFGLVCSKAVNGFDQKYLRYVAKDYLISYIFLFDFLNFIMTFFKIILPKSSAVGIICFAVTAASIPVLSRNFQIVETVFFNNFRKRQYFSIFKILTFNIFFAQFVSSIMMAISFYDLKNNWIRRAIDTGSMESNLSWWQIYFHSMYWAITTLTTTGFGDITPGNYFQVAIVALIMLFGTAVLSYNLSEIGSVISNLRSIDKRRKQEVVIFKRMAIDQHISEHMTNKILDYIQKSAQVRAQFQFEQRNKFIQDLPSQLKEQFQSQYMNSIFFNVPFFNLLQRQTLIDLSMKMDGQIYYPGESITKKDGSLPSIMFLKHGRIGLAYQKAGSVLNGLVLQRRKINRQKDNPYLLNKYLFTQDKQISYQIISQNYCFLLILKYVDFNRVIRQSKKDKEFYFNLYNKTSFVEQQLDQFQCKYCAPKRHTVFICPKFHYMPYISIVIQKQIFGPNVLQQRKVIYKRRQSKIRQKTALTMWKQFLRHVQVQWPTGCGKVSTKSSTKINHKQIQSEENKQVKNQFILKISQQILRSHCCLIDQYYKNKKNMYIDKMHNFTNFFPDFNPQNLRKQSLKLPHKYKRHKNHEFLI